MFDDHTGWSCFGDKKKCFSSYNNGLYFVLSMLNMLNKRNNSVHFSGVTGAGSRYSSQFVKAAKLLHWNGHYKPWGRGSSFTDVWDKWFIPDPTGKFHPVRRHTGDS